MYHAMYENIDRILNIYKEFKKNNFICYKKF